MSKLTRRQHYVPDFYLKQWSNSKGQITCHDLSKEKSFTCNPANTLVQSYFYEENRDEPDNRIENILATMEGNCARVFKKISSISDSKPIKTNIEEFISNLKKELTTDDLADISQFAAYQYLRVPGAINQKEFESRPSELTKSERVHALNPGRFVESGYAYIKDQFISMKILIMVSKDRDFITSDWPCFDLKDSQYSPLLGEEIGKNPEVVCYLPLAPKLSAVFYPNNFSNNSHLIPRLQISLQKDILVRNQNTLIIQQAERFVVASKEEPFIFKIAAKRKKGRLLY